MTNCVKMRELLPLSAGGDLEAGDAARVQAHLSSCPACRVELAEFRQLISLTRTIDGAAERLPATVKRRIASEAAAAARGGFWQGWSNSLAWPLLGRAPGGLTAATLAAALVALIAVPVAMRDSADLPPQQGEVARGVAAPERIDMSFQAGTVRLAWSDGREGGYIVSKSSDPRGLAGVEEHRVNGNTWVDSDPETSRIVYYRIE